MVSKARRWAVPVLLLAVALLLSSPTVSAKYDRHDRRLHQATAVATSRAEAKGPGSTAVSNVNAGAVSTGGKPATAVSQGASVAEAGQTVISQCDVFAVDTEQYKKCVGTPQAQKANVSANPAAAAAAGVVSYEAAPTCTPPPSNAIPDDSGRLWGYQNGSSCAFRFPNGEAMYKANLTAVGGGGGGGNITGGNATAAAITFESAPACPGAPTTANSTADVNGNLFGTSNGTTCAYKDAQGNPLTLQGAAGEGAAGGNTATNATSSAEAVTSGGTANAGANSEAVTKHHRRRLHMARFRTRHQ